MRWIIRSAVAVLVSLIASVSAPVPHAAAQELARIYHVTPENGAAFEAALAKHVRDRIDHDDPWSWDVLQEVVGEDLGDFFYRSGGHSWADFDAYDQGFGADAGLHYEIDVAPLVEETSMWITQEDTAHLRLPADQEWPDIDYIELITYHLQPGKERQFSQVIGTIHDAIEEADWPVRYAWAHPVLGQGGPRMTLAVFHEDWADFQEPATPFMEMLREQLGDDEAQEVMQQLGDSYRYVESAVLRWRKDLSVPPPAMRGSAGGGGQGGAGGNGQGGGGGTGQDGGGR